ncbi:MAG: hypothetical protein WCL10_17995 [Novosphingobium sp.]|uniref:hypothetical protein n=1 Tax=Novosphingobium sp. TaxID=1874826 RepID=UPI0030196760
MHTVRNRLASRPPIKQPAPSGHKPPHTAALQHELAYLQRGSMAVPLAIPDASGLIEARLAKRRTAKGKKARKAAARLAAAREAQALATGHDVTTSRPPKTRGKGGAAKVGAAKIKTGPAATVKAETAPTIAAQEDSALLQQCLAAEPALALTLPARPEPLVVEARDVLPDLRIDAPALPALPKPLAETLPITPEPEAAAAAPADEPLPRARALVPARRQGLVDVIAFLLRDSGRRLARWSSHRHKSKAQRSVLRIEEARQINLQRELEALEALHRNKG